MSRYAILDELAPELLEASVADDHLDVPECEGMPARGRALLRDVDWGDGSSGPMCWFKCPRDRLYCGVPVKPSPPNGRGCSWTLIGGTPEAPSLAPSIDCSGVGCGWHGHITNGEVVG